MTEESFQKTRKVMQLANNARSMITKAKGDVSKWTRMEAAFKENLQPTRAEGARKMLVLAIAKLEKARAKFREIKLPDSNITIPYTPSLCECCGELTAKGTIMCGECSC